jgi:hypothetical protein
VPMRSALVLFALCTAFLQAAEIRGKVVNSHGGEPLQRVSVFLADSQHTRRTITDGTFVLPDVSPGNYFLVADAVGYWQSRTAIEIKPSDTALEFEIVLQPEGGRRLDKIEVIADRFHGPQAAEVSLLDVTAEELKQTGTLLASDPFRTVQTLPGVSASANNDLFAQFTVLGAGFESIAIQIDDVPVTDPLHGLPGESDGASVGILNNDIIESMTLTPLAYSERYWGGIGGALDIRTREGSRTRPTFNVFTGLAETHGTAEGGFAQKRGSWLASARKSYIGYLANHAVNEPTVDVGFYDLHGNVTYDVSPSNTLNITATHSLAHLEQINVESLGPNDLATGQNRFDLLRAGWQGVLSEKIVLSAFAAFTNSRYEKLNDNGSVLNSGSWGTWVGGSRLLWNTRASDTLEIGWLTIRQRNAQTFGYIDPENPTAPQGIYTSPGNALQHGAYVQQSSSFLKDRLHVMAGLRWDHNDTLAANPFSPQASADFRVASSSHLQFGFGKYLMFLWPDSIFPCGGSESMYYRGTHYVAGVEQGIGELARLKVQVFHRDENVQTGIRGGLSYLDDLLNGVIQYNCGAIERYRSPRPVSQANGTQIALQRRSSNRLAGWIAYTYLHAKANQSYGQYPSVYDQRHTVNVFASYRLRPSIQLGGKLLYGSGYPVPGSFTEIAPGYYQQNAYALNQVRLDPYFRADASFSKTFSIHGRRLTLSSEVLNLTNHHNLRLIRTDYLSTGQVILNRERTLGITPTVGLGFQF